MFRTPVDVVTNVRTNIFTTALLLLVTSPLLVQSQTCSNYPNLPRCHIRRVTEDYQPRSDASVEWPAGPSGLRTFLFVESHQNVSGSIDLVASTRIVWRFPEANKTLPMAIEGFLLTVTRIPSNYLEELENSTAIWKFEAKLDSAVSRIGEDQKKHEFFFDAYRLFDFGQKYKIDVVLLPLARRGVTSHIRNFQSVKNDKICVPNEETAEIARRWTPKGDTTTIHVMIVQAAVNVSFIRAPENLCIDHYSIQVHVKETSMVIEYIANKTSNIMQHHLFENLPRDKVLVVKIVAFNYKNERCSCLYCHCLTYKSPPFLIQSLKRDVLTSSTSYPVVTSSYGMAFLGLFVVLLLLLAAFSFVTILCALRQKAHYQNKKVYLHRKDCTSALIQRHTSHRVLLVTTSGSKKENEFVDNMARLMINSTSISLKFDRFDLQGMERNVHLWTSESLKECDKIIMVHTKNVYPSQSQEVFQTVRDVISLKAQVILIKLHHQAEITFAIQETVYLFPRDLPILCSHLSIVYDHCWIDLYKKCYHLYDDQESKSDSNLSQIVDEILSSSSLQNIVDDLHSSMISTESDKQDSGHGSSLNTISSTQSHTVNSPIMFRTSLPESPMDSGYQSKSSL